MRRFKYFLEKRVRNRMRMEKKQSGVIALALTLTLFLYKETDKYRTLLYGIKAPFSMMKD